MKAAATASQSVAALARERRIEISDGPAAESALAAPAPDAGTGFRLLRYFSFASLIAIALAVVGLGFFFRQTALKQLVKVGEENNVAVATVFVNTLRPRYGPLIETGANAPSQERTHRRLAEVHDAVLNAVRGTHVVRVRIYDLQGRTLYSSDPRQIGEDRSRDAGFLAAREGGVRTVLRQYDSFEAIAGPLVNRELVASHIPVRRAGTEQIDAVFELHSDVTPYREEIRQTQRHIRYGVAAVMILLYGTLFFIVRRADNVIRSQEAQRRVDEETIRHLAHHDTLTGLPNRQLFAERLEFTLARARRTGRMAALMFVDLDRFKHINDTLGHAVGDRVLKAAGRLLRASLRDVDTVARLGGDEFTIILEDIANAGQVVTVADKIEAAFDAPVITADGIDISVTPSIGIALYPSDADTLEALLHAADAAMYEAKSAGRHTYRFYRAES